MARRRRQATGSRSDGASPASTGSSKVGCCNLRRCPDDPTLSWHYAGRGRRAGAGPGCDKSDRDSRTLELTLLLSLPSPSRRFRLSCALHRHFGPACSPSRPPITPFLVFSSPRRSGRKDERPRAAPPASTASASRVRLPFFRRSAFAWTLARVLASPRRRAPAPSCAPSSTFGAWARSRSDGLPLRSPPSASERYALPAASASARSPSR